MTHPSDPPPATPATPTRPPEAAPRPRPGRGAWALLGVAVLLVVALTAALLVVRAEADARPQARVGEVFDLEYGEDPLPDRGEVVLPWRRLEVGAGDVRQELPDLLGGEPNVRAPDGGSFVRVEVDLLETSPAFTALDTPLAGEVTLVLRAGGRAYDLNGRTGFGLDPNGDLFQGGSRWVAVDGEPDDLEVVVGVDGVEQVVRADGTVDAGRAAALADLPTAEQAQQRSVPCGTPRRDDDAADLRLRDPAPECQVGLLLRTPYVDGLGWAAEGEEFLVVTVGPRTYDLDALSGADVLWSGGAPRVTASVGGRPALATVRVNDLAVGPLTLQDPDDPVMVVLGVDEGATPPDLDLRMQTTVVRRDGPPAQRTVALRWRVPGEDLG